MKYIIFFLLLQYNLIHAQSKSEIRIDDLDLMMNEVIDIVGFPGVALAVIKNGKVVHRANYGYASLEHEVALSNQSSFQLYSLTKPIIATAIFGLIEKGELSLETSIREYINDLPTAWSAVKVKHLMTHSSGLPDMFGSNPYEFQELTEGQAKQRVFAIPSKFAPGERYEYNQTNSWLMKAIIESVTNEDLEDYIRRTQFPGASDESMYFLSDAREIVKHKVTSYFPWLRGHLTIDLPYVNGEYFYAGNGLHLTLSEMIKWDQRFSNNEIISEKTKQKMWKPFNYSNDDEIFASGWNIHRSSDTEGYGFTGSSVTMYRTIPSKNLSIILLANGFENNYSQHALMDQIIQLVENQ